MIEGRGWLDVAEILVREVVIITGVLEVIILLLVLLEVIFILLWVVLSVGNAFLNEIGDLLEEIQSERGHLVTLLLLGICLWVDMEMQSLVLWWLLR